MVEDQELRAQLRRLAPRKWLPNPQRFDLRQLNAGAYHANFYVECDGVASIIRLNRRSQWGLSSEAQLEREYKTLLHLAPTRAAPQALEFVRAPLPFLVEAYISGRKFRYRDDLVDAAEAIASIHLVDLAGVELFLPSDRGERFLVEDGLRWLELAEQGGATATTRLLHQAAERLTRATARTRAHRTSIIHTDLMASNLIVTGSGCVITDWEGARVSSTAWDLAYFLSPVTIRWSLDGADFVRDEDREQFLERYAAAVRAEPSRVRNEIEDFLPFVIFRALCWCVGFEQTEPHDHEARRRLANFTDAAFVEGVL